MNTSKSLDSILEAYRDFWLNPKAPKIANTAETKVAIVEAVEGIYGDSDGLREFASTPTNQVVNPSVNKRKDS